MIRPATPAEAAHWFPHLAEALAPGECLVADGGAVVAQALPGRVGVIVPPVGEDSAAAGLLEAGLERLRSQGVRVAQVYQDDPLVMPLPGFDPVTHVHFLVGPTTPHAPSELRFDPPTNRQRLGELLIRTYEGSLDAPEMNLGATADELLAGFTDATDIRIVHDGDAAFGLLVLKESQFDYLGIVPERRGMGAGKEVVRFALDCLNSQGFAEASVAVDARNTPAMKLYGRFGFQTVQTQRLDLHWL